LFGLNWQVTFDDDKNSSRAHACLTGGVDSAMMQEALVPLMRLGACALLLIAFWGLASR
jgi:hypothetical protein